MNKVLVDRDLLERLMRADADMGREGSASFTLDASDRLDRAWAELRAILAQPAEAEGVELQRLADEFDAAPDDAEWEPPHPIFQMARDLDRVTAALSAVTAERDAANSRLHEVAVACATAEQERDQLRAEVERLRNELAGKPLVC